MPERARTDPREPQGSNPLGPPGPEVRSDLRLTEGPLPEVSEGIATIAGRVGSIVLRTARKRPLKWARVELRKEEFPREYRENGLFRGLKSPIELIHHK